MDGHFTYQALRGCQGLLLRLEAPVDIQHMSGYEGCLIREQPRDALRNFFGVPHAAHGMHGGDGGLIVLSHFNAAEDNIGLDRARSHRVDSIL